MPFSSVINRAYLLILILKKIMCIYIYIYIYIYINYLKKKKTNAQMTHAYIIYDDCNKVRLLILSKIIFIKCLFEKIFGKKI